MLLSLPTRVSAQEAFDVVADFGRLEEWDPTVARSEWATGAWPRVGSTVRMSTRRWLGGAQLVYTLRHVESGRSARYEGGTRRIRSVETFTFIDRPGGSLVRIESRIFTGGWLRWLGPVIRWGVRTVGPPLVVRALRRRLASTD